MQPIQKKQTVALIMPVLNESSDVQLTLDSVFASTRLPDEVIIADGGSTDDTLMWIERYQNRGVPILLTQNPKVFAGAGRNAAAALTKCDILLCVDFGNRLDRHWIAEMSRPFEQDSQIDFAEGTSVPLIRSDYEYCVAAIHHHLNALLSKTPIIELLKNHQDNTQEGVNQQHRQQPPEALNRYVLSKQLPKILEPGGLGLGVKLSTWQRIGGMPDWLRASENHLFGRKLMQTQSHYKTCFGARLYHHMRSSPSALFKQMFIYTRGSGQTHHKLPLVLKTAGVYGVLLSCLLLPFPRQFNIVFLLLLFIGYGYHQGIRKVRKVAMQNFKLAYIPLSFAVLIPRDMGMISGYLKGCYDWWTDPKYPIHYSQYFQGENNTPPPPSDQ